MPQAEIFPGILKWSGEIFHDPSWIITTGNRRIEAEWRSLDPAVIAYRGHNRDVVKKRSVFNVLIFAGDAEIRLDARRIDGRPYLRDAWKENIGRDLTSSCVIALARHSSSRGICTESASVTVGGETGCT